MTDPGRAVFLSYASEDAEAAQRLCVALRSAGIEVWFDQSELRGGDAWDASIRRQIKNCALFIPLISRNSHNRGEGYFRFEWKLAVDRSHLMASDLPFLLPVVIDDTPDEEDRVPDRFREVQWTRLPAGANAEEFVSHVRRLLVPAAATDDMRSGPPPALPASGQGPTAAGVRNLASRKRALWIVGAFVVIALGYSAADRFWLSRRATPAAAAPILPALATLPSASSSIPEKSVAVLPFVDMSEKHDQEYFSDGLSEELIDHLTQAVDLKVIARTSSFQFKGKNDDMRSIGRKLGVANLLEGSVRTSGNYIRVTAQLINVNDGTHRWSETYDRKKGDIFKVQDEIAAAVVTALKASLSGDPASGMQFTTNLEAYTYYLKGQQKKHMAFTKEEEDQVVVLFRKSVSLDPAFAEGWNSVMGSLSNEVIDGNVMPNAVAPEMRHAAQEVARLAPGSAIAHEAAAQIYWALDWDVPSALREYQKAYDLEPRLPTLAKRLADTIYTLGGDDATVLRLYREAVALDPLDPYTYMDLVFFHLHRGSLKEAESALEKMRTVAPSMPGIDTIACELFVVGGKPHEALSAAQREADPDSRRVALALAYQALGRQSEADAAMAEVEKQDGVNSPYDVAQLHAFRRESDQAFDWLNRAIQRHDQGLMLVNSDFLMKSLHADVRWKSLLERLNLPSL